MLSIGKVLLVICFSRSCLAEFVTQAPTKDYNYTANTLLNISNISNTNEIANEIILPFNIFFQGYASDTFYVCTNSYITFQREQCRIEGPENNMWTRGILIESDDNFALSLVVKCTSQNITVHYIGCRYGDRITFPNNSIEWFLTFYNVPYQHFDLDIKSNFLSSKGTGVSSLCYFYTRYQAIETSSPGILGYWDCVNGSFYAAGPTCNLSFSNCKVCDSVPPTSFPTYCSICKNGYFLDSSTNTSCISCNNSNYGTSSTSCIRRCASYVPSFYITNSCSQCDFGYAGNQCQSCAVGFNSMMDGSCSNPSCSQVIGGRCFTCSGNRQPPYCADCKIGYTGADCQDCVDIESTPDCVKPTCGGSVEGSCYYCKNPKRIPSTNCSECYEMYTGKGCQYCVDNNDIPFRDCVSLNCSSIVKGKCVACKGGRQPPYCEHCYPGYIMMDNSSCISAGLIIGLPVCFCVLLGVLIGGICFCRRARRVRKEEEARIISLAASDSLTDAAHDPASMPPLKLADLTEDVLHLPKELLSNGSADLCSICLEPSPNIATSCQHFFHVDCLRLQTQRDRQCPSCSRKNSTFLSKCEKCCRYRVLTTFAGSLLVLKTCESCQIPRPGDLDKEVIEVMV